MKKNLKCIWYIAFILSSSGILFTSCTSNKNQDSAKADQSTIEKAEAQKNLTIASMKIDPKGEKPSWAPDITGEMQAVIEKHESFNVPPLNTLSAQEARKQPTPSDAVISLMTENNIPMPSMNVDTMGKDIAVQGGKIHLRIYTPTRGDGPFPVIVYYHGGGWVIANLDTYDVSAKSLANKTGAVLVSVAYRQAPEYKFPTAHNDAYAAYEWVMNNAATIKADPKQIIVAGESAGGNLAASVSMMARNKGVSMPIHQLLVYPIAGNDLNTESYQKYADAKPLNKALMSWFFDNYLPNKTAGNNPMISLVKANLSGLPSTTIIAAQLDPLQSEGKMLADKLKSAGVPVTYKMYDGVTHEFFGMAAIVPKAATAQEYAANEIKKAINKVVSQK
ncbi:MAG: alpha/beta hydrolase [Cytophagaceae bacterium]|nr:alpha/beta hydrolase [Cytophagaceae bacterium]